MKLLAFTIAVVLSSQVAMTSNSFAADRCEAEFSAKEIQGLGASWAAFKVGSLKKIKGLNENAPIVFAQMQILAAEGSIEQSLSPRDIENLLADVEQPLYGEILTDVAVGMANDFANAANRAEAFKSSLDAALTKRGYSKKLIQSKTVQLSMRGAKNWKSILGDLDLRQTHQMFYGNSLSSPDADSVVGRYLAETQAQFRVMQVKRHQNNGPLSPERLVIAVSNETFDAFNRIVMSNYNFMTVLSHAAIIHNGAFYKHSGDKYDVRMPNMHTPLPILLFKTTEAQRLHRYLELTPVLTPNYQWNHALKEPYRLGGYSAQSRYTCCTHWIGNMPIGDKLVNEYAFPGYADDPDHPNTQALKPYKAEGENEILTTIWKVPGHEQLADVIGQRRANLSGEFASPGWVIQTLYGATMTERVPIIFWVTDDHTQPIPDDPTFSHEGAY